MTDWPAVPCCPNREGFSIATWKQQHSKSPGSHPCSCRCLTFRTKQALRAAVAGEVDFTASFAPRIDWSQDLHKQSPVGTSWCWCFSCLTPAPVRLELGMNLLHSRGRGSDTGGEPCPRCLWIKQEASPGDSNPCRRNAVRCALLHLSAAAWGFTNNEKFVKNHPAAFGTPFPGAGCSKPPPTIPSPVRGGW